MEIGRPRHRLAQDQSRRLKSRALLDGFLLQTPINVSGSVISFVVCLRCYCGAFTEIFSRVWCRFAARWRAVHFGGAGQREWSGDSRVGHQSGGPRSGDGGRPRGDPPAQALHRFAQAQAAFICTRGGTESRHRIGDLLPKEWGELFSVGRLDCQSEGLIFLTNDGDFCLKLTHPRYGISKTYMARVEGRVEPGDYWRSLSKELSAAGKF